MRLTFELWWVHLETRGEISAPIVDPLEAWAAAPEKPSSTMRKLTAYLRRLKMLEKQTKALGKNASALAARPLTALTAIVLLMANDLELYRLRMQERRKRLAGREVRGRRPAPSTPQLEKLNRLLEWVPTPKRWAVVAELHAFATGQPVAPEQIRLLLKDAKKRQRRQRAR